MRSERRRFLQLSASAALASPFVVRGWSGLFVNGYAETLSPDRWKGQVAVARDGSPQYNVTTYSNLLDKGLARLLETDRPVEIWKRLFRPDDVVSIKVNAMAGRQLSPSYDLIRALVGRLSLAGVSEDRIIVWDRTSRELQRAGYPLNKSGRGVKVFGTDAMEDGYDREISQAMSVGSCLARIMSRYSTATINVGVLKDHDLAGISVLMKNFYGAIHNPNKYHDQNCSPYIAHLCTHPEIRGKVRLHVVDAPVGQYQGGPAFHGSHTWPFRGLIVATDPVAADRIALECIDRQREKAGLVTLAAARRAPAWLDEAGRLGLGESDRKRIRLYEV